MVLALMWVGAKRARRVGLAGFGALLFAGAVWAANFASDGNIADWTGESPRATDAAGDASLPDDGADLLQFYAAFEEATIFFRADAVDIENQRPIAVDQAQTFLEDAAAQTIVLTATDGDGDPLTFAIVANPTQGTLGAITPINATSASVAYTPNPNANGADSFTFSANDGQASSLPATVSITITPVNDAPSFTAGANVTVLKDTGAQTISPWATAISTGPANESAQTLSFTITANDNAAMFSVLPAISPTGVLTFTTAANANGVANLSVQVQDNGGTANGGVDVSAPQNFSISFTAVNDAPSFTVGPNQTVLEDSGAQTVNPWATAISAGPPDEVAQTLTFNVTGNTNAALFSAAPAISPTGALTYTPAANANGVATISLNLQDNGGTANGGIDTSAVQTFTITVTAVNDTPSFTAGANVTVLKDTGPQTVNPWATAISAGPADESAQTLSFTVTANDNAALFSVQPTISPTGVLTFTGTANANGVANLSVQIQDNGGTANGAIDVSAVQNFSISMTAVNDAPSFTAGPNQTVLEDSGAQTVNPWATAISAGPPDEVAQTLTFNVTGNTNAALFSAAPAISPTGALTYTPAANANGVATISLNLQDNGGTADGGIDTSAVQTFTITVTAVNDVPSYTAQDPAPVAEDAGPQTASIATAISAGPPDEIAQTLTFSIASNSNAALFNGTPTISPAGVLSFTPAANTSGTAVLSVTLQDNGGTANSGFDTSAAQNVTVTVNSINDAPSFTVGANQSVAEDAGAQTVNPWATAIVPGPADESAQTVTFNVTGNTNAALFSTAPAISPTGVLTYTPAVDAFGVATISLTLQDNGGTANGGIDTSAVQTFTITVTAVNDAPVNSLPPIQNIGTGEVLAFNTVNGNAISVVDVDAAAGNVTTTISTTVGILSATSTNGAVVTGNNSASLSITDVVADVNATLQTLTFTSAVGGTATVTVLTSDLGNTGAGGTQTDTDNVSINIDSPPSVQNVSPLAGASNLAMGAAVIVSFSEPVAALANALNVTCAPSGSSANTTASANTTTLNLTGAAIGAQAGDTCTVTVTAASITDIDAIDPPDAMVTNFVSTYTIDSAPAVTSTTPINGASNVATNSTITVNFSEPVNVTVGGFALSCSSGPAITLTPATLTNGISVVLSPSPALPPTATCTLTVNAANVTDVDTADAPDNMAANFIATFSTTDPAPTVVGTSPINSGTGSATGDITVTFSEAVTFTAASFTLECPVSTPIPFAVSGSGSNIATINPTGNLPVGTLCTVTVLQGGISDVDAIDPPDNMAADSIFTFTPTNTPPTLTAGATANYVEDGPAAVIDNTITVADTDNTSLASATVEITTNFVTGEDMLTFVNTANITGAYNVTNGVLNLTGTDTLAAYQAALRSVRYLNTSNTPSILPRTISWIGNDGVAQSAPVTSTVNVAATDDAPTAVADAATVVEDSGANAINVLANDTDPDAGTISISAVTQPANGVVVITGGGDGLTYAPNANYCNTPPGTTLSTFTYTLTPGGSSTTVTVSVTCVDDDPVAVADNATVVEDSAANAINVLSNDTDVDGGAISISAITQPANGTVVITGVGTGLTYQPNANYCNAPPGTTLDTFTYTLTPGGSSTTVTVTVTCIDDSPVAVADAATVLEDSGANAINVLLNDTDLDGGPKSVTSTTQPANGAVVITGGGTGLTYAPNANYCNTPPGTTLDAFTYTLTPGGSSTTVTVTVNCVNDPPVAGNDAFDFIGNTELRVDLAAAATPHALEATVAGVGVLGNDSDPVEGNTFTVSSLTVGGCTDASAPFTCSDPAVGTVTMAAGGTFSFVPAPGDTGATETFTYQITDNGTPTPASATGTVTMTRFNRIWYVDPNGAAGGNGTSSNPLIVFTALNGAGGAGDVDLAGDYIFVHDGTIAGALELEGNQRLLGEGVALSMPVNLNGNGSPTDLVAAGTRPQWNNSTGNAISIGAAIPIEIRGLSLASTSGNAIDLTSAAALTGSGALEIASNVVTGASAEGFDINLNAGTTGTLSLSIHDNTLTATGNALDIVRNAGTVNITNFANNVVTATSAASGIVVNGIGAPITFDATPGAGYNTVSGGTTTIGVSGDGVGTNGLLLSNIAGDLNFADLDVFASNGSAVVVSGTGLVNVGAGTGTRVSVGSNVGIFNATNGAALDLSNITADMQGLNLSSVNSTGTGVSLASVGNGSTAASVSMMAGSSISNATGTDFLISGGNAAVTYAGTITDATGTVVSVASTTGGIKTFSGAITSGAVTLAANAGATINFTGGLVLSTGATAAFNATGGGAVTVTGAANTLATTTGTALNVVNTTIGASGLTFRSVNVDGDDANPVNGIVLNNTGSSSGLTITGTGATGTGGTIRDTSDDAIALTNTERVTLGSMNITSNLGSGIAGAGVNGFDLNNLSITANGNSAADDESGINLANLTGTAAAGARPTRIANSTISNNFEFEVHITNSTGTLTDLQMSGNSISSDGLQLNHGNLMNFLVSGGSTASMTLNVTSGSFTGNTDISGGRIITATGVQCDHSGAGGTMTCNVGGATFTNNNVGPQASVAGGGQMIFDFNNNNVQGSRSHAINVFADANPPFTKTINGRIRNNTVGTIGLVGSGSTVGFPIRVQNEGRIATNLAITGNQVRESVGFTGINVNHGISLTAGTGATNVTITGNAISDIDSGRAVLVQANDFAPAGGNAGTVCVDIGGNSMTNIAGQAGDGSRIRLRQSASSAPSVFNVRQNAATGAAVFSELDDANGFNDPLQVSVGGTPTYNAGACPQPSN